MAKRNALQRWFLKSKLVRRIVLACIRSDRELRRQVEEHMRRHADYANWLNKGRADG